MRQADSVFRIQSGRHGGLKAIADQTGRADNIIAILSTPAEMRSEMEDFLVKWGF